MLELVLGTVLDIETPVLGVDDPLGADENVVLDRDVGAPDAGTDWERDDVDRADAETDAVCRVDVTAPDTGVVDLVLDADRDEPEAEVLREGAAELRVAEIFSPDVTEEESKAVEGTDLDVVAVAEVPRADAVELAAVGDTSPPVDDDRPMLPAFVVELDDLSLVVYATED